jgi:hypothetical protein
MQSYGADGDRTHGLQSAILALSQLSYCPNKNILRTVMKYTYRALKNLLQNVGRGAWGAAVSRPTFDALHSEHNFIN